jgi:proteic killer suppression protein
VITRVVVTERAKKDLRKVPSRIADRLYLWAKSVAEIGLEEVRKVPGYHDEPLRGDRAGQRSIRLNRQWRAIYTLESDAARIEFVRVDEVTPHKY